MTRQLKCHKCKKLIDEDEKAYRCSDCETYPFHEGCLDEDGNCAECAKECEKTEEEDEDTEYQVIVETSTDSWTINDTYTRKQATALMNKIRRAVETGKPKTMVIGPSKDMFFVVKNIATVKIEEE